MPDSIGGDAGGVICIELDEKMPNVGSLNGKLVIELVGLSEQIGDARSEPVDMLNGGLMANGCIIPFAFIIDEALRPKRCPFVCADFVMASTSADEMPRPIRFLFQAKARKKKREKEKEKQLNGCVE